jgi:hypothetical protein
MKRPATKPDPIDGPAMLRPDHVQDRHLDKVGDRKGWRKLTPCEKAHRLGHLLCKERCAGGPNSEETRLEIERALNRREAWNEFTEKWLLCQATFPASDYNRIKIAGIPGSFADHQIDTKRFLRAVEAHLGARDWMIARRVCGESWSIAEAVVAIDPGYRKSTLVRFRECLDRMIEALESARRG